MPTRLRASDRASENRNMPGQGDRLYAPAEGTLSRGQVSDQDHVSWAVGRPPGHTIAFAFSAER
jgi:hypothetical protein